MVVNAGSCLKQCTCKRHDLPCTELCMCDGGCKEENDDLFYQNWILKHIAEMDPFLWSHYLHYLKIQ